MTGAAVVSPEEGAVQWLGTVAAPMTQITSG
jgi:hypothetical protein